MMRFFTAFGLRLFWARVWIVRFFGADQEEESLSLGFRVYRFKGLGFKGFGV